MIGRIAPADCVGTVRIARGETLLGRMVGHFDQQSEIGQQSAAAKLVQCENLRVGEPPAPALVGAG